LLYLVSDQCHFMMYMDSRLGISYDFIKKNHWCSSNVHFWLVFENCYSSTITCKFESVPWHHQTKILLQQSSFFMIFRQCVKFVTDLWWYPVYKYEICFWDFLILCKCCILCKFCFRASVFYAELLLWTLYLLFTHIWEYLILCIQKIYNNIIWTNLSDFHIIIDNV